MSMIQEKETKKNMFGKSASNIHKILKLSKKLKSCMKFSVTFNPVISINNFNNF